VLVPAEQGNAVDAFGPEPVRFSDARVGLGATDCCRSALLCGWEGLECWSEDVSDVERRAL
jgi:hypothetical protein